MLNNIKELITILKKARKEKKWSQGELAQKVGLPQSHISKIEGGGVNMRLGNFVEMTRLLELEVMLVPKGSVVAIKSLLGSEIKPLYTLDEEDDNA